MQFQTAKFLCVSLTALLVAACGGGGGGGDGGGDPRSVKERRLELFATGVWSAQGLGSSSTALQEFLIFNDGENVRMVGCDLTDSFDENLVWQADTLLSNTNGSLQIRLTPGTDNRITISQDDVTVNLSASSSSSRLSVTGLPSANPQACGVVDGLGGVSYLTTIDGAFYFLGIDFSQDINEVNYADPSEARVAFVEMNSLVRRLEIAAGRIGNFIVDTASVSVSGCSDRVMGDVSGLSLGGTNFSVGFDAAPAPSQAVPCNLAPRSGEVLPAEGFEAFTQGNLVVSLDPAKIQCSAGAAPSGELSNLWRFDLSFAQSVALRLLARNPLVSEVLSELPLDQLLTTDYLILENEGVGPTSSVDLAVCGASKEFSGFTSESNNALRFGSFVRSGNSLSVVDDGMPLGQVFSAVEVVDADTLRLNVAALAGGFGGPLVDSLPKALQQITIRRITRSDRQLCLATQSGGSEVPVAAPLSELGCADFDLSSQAEAGSRLLSISSVVDNQQTLIYVTFQDEVRLGEYWLDTSDPGRNISTVQVKHADGTELVAAQKAYFNIVNLNTPVLAGEFIIELPATEVDAAPIVLQGYFEQPRF